MEEAPAIVRKNLAGEVHYPYITEEDIFTARNATEKEMDKGMAMIVISIVTGIIAAVLAHI